LGLGSGCFAIAASTLETKLNRYRAEKDK